MPPPVYTLPSRSMPSGAFSGRASPALVFTKWQAWDDFPVDKKFDRKGSRLEYLQKIVEAVQSIYKDSYNGWHNRYTSAITTLGAETISCSTLWRLIIGWGANPALETGLTLHHLYGFPYIPGSAVKGLLHHVAELETMDLVEDESLFKKVPTHIPSPPEWMENMVANLQLIRILFGSVHLERHKLRNKDTGQEREYGLQCPRPLLKELHTVLKTNCPKGWQNFLKDLNLLLSDNTGGMLRFYDAVPAPEQQSNLLQTDIVNCHYSEYYSDDQCVIPPSDDQSPNPVTFLAVSPGIEFIFPFRLNDWPLAPGRDKEEKQYLEVLNAFTRESVREKLRGLIDRSLGEWGVGAKTTSGYGYFLRSSREASEKI